MSRVVHLSDEQYQVAESLATALGQTDPSWLETAREAQTREGAPTERFPTTEAFFARLGADEEQLAEARRLDQAADIGKTGPNRADV